MYWYAKSVIKETEILDEESKNFKRGGKNRPCENI